MPLNKRQSKLSSLWLLLSSWQVNAFTPPIPNACRQQHTHQSLSSSSDNNKKKKNWISKGTPSYSDNWLLDFHNFAQDEYQTETNQLKIWNKELDQDQFSFLEWQDSFHRNGLSDFCPPMSANLNCLVVGEGMAGRQADDDKPHNFESNKLPWEEEPEANITELRIIHVGREESPSDLTTTRSANDNNPASTMMIRTERVVSNNNNNDADASDDSFQLSVPSSTGQAAVYDCVIDQGLMQAVLALDDPKAIAELTMEAATAIREHGIYVLVTTQPLSEQQKMMLQASGKQAGLEWVLELDGISDCRLEQIVSVARRFNTGVMPKVSNKLSRYRV